MKRSLTTCIQKEMNRTQITLIQQIIANLLSSFKLQTYKEILKDSGQTDNVVSQTH